MIEPVALDTHPSHFSQSVIAENSTIPRKFRAVFSGRVATRQNCFIRLMHCSTSFRSYSTTASYPRGALRFDRGGIITSASRASTAAANASLSYPLSPGSDGRLVVAEQRRGVRDVCVSARTQADFQR